MKHSIAILALGGLAFGVGSALATGVKGAGCIGRVSTGTCTPVNCNGPLKLNGGKGNGISAGFSCMKGPFPEDCGGGSYDCGTAGKSSGE